MFFKDKIVFVFILVFIFVAFLLFMYFSTFKYISTDTAVWGAFGDYIGGILNPIFAFLSFSALLITLIYQNRQLEQNQEILKDTKRAIEQNESALKLNQDALELNRRELSISNDQLTLSAKAHIEIEKTQKIQQFDMLFTTMLNELNIINKDFNERNLINDFYKIFEKTDSLLNKQLDLRRKYLLTRYFIILYQILKLISENNFIENDGKKKYSNIIRASVENALLQLLMLNCNCEDYLDDFCEFYCFLKEFSFLEHMDFNLQNSNEIKSNFVLIQCLVNYDDEVFGTSLYLEDAKEIWYYGIIKENKEISSVADLFYYVFKIKFEKNKIIHDGFEFFMREDKKNILVYLKQISSNEISEFKIPNLKIDLNDSYMIVTSESRRLEVIFKYEKDKLRIKAKFELNSYQLSQLNFTENFDQNNWIIIQ